MTSSQCRQLLRLLIICFILSSRLTAADGIILQKPVLTIGYMDQRASFSCTVGNNYRLTWYLTENYTRSNHLAGLPYGVITESQLADPTTLTSIMTVHASAATNNTIVFCRAYRYPDTVFANASLLVQDRLAAPSNLTVTEIAYVFKVTFEKPYYLPGAVITHYGFVIDVPSQNLTINSTFNDTHFQLQLSDYNISRCEDQYIVLSVCAVNPAGEGEFSSTTVFVSADSRYCDLTTSPQLHLSDSILLSVMISMLTSLATFGTVFLLIWAVHRHRLSQMKRNRTTPSEESKEVCPTTLNDAYAGTYPMVKNEAYSSSGVKEPPHVYDTVKDIVSGDPVYETIDVENKGKKSYDKYQDA